MQKELVAVFYPQSSVDKLEKEKMPRKGGRWWFSWRRRDFPAEEVGGWPVITRGQLRARNRICLWMFFPQHSAQREKTAAREQQG